MILNTPEDLHAIFDNRANVRKGDYYEAYARDRVVRNTLSVIDKSKHAFQRRILGAAFSDKAMSSAEIFVIRNVNRWCELLKDDSHNDWSAPINMSEQAEYLVFDILGDLAFSRNFNVKEPGENKFRRVPKLITAYVKFMHPVSGLKSIIDHCNS